MKNWATFLIALAWIVYGIIAVIAMVTRQPTEFIGEILKNGAIVVGVISAIILIARAIVFMDEPI